MIGWGHEGEAFLMASEERPELACLLFLTRWCSLSCNDAAWMPLPGAHALTLYFLVSRTLLNKLPFFICYTASDILWHQQTFPTCSSFKNLSYLFPHWRWAQLIWSQPTTIVGRTSDLLPLAIFHFFFFFLRQFKISHRDYRVENCHQMHRRHMSGKIVHK
jgi:hypothetical protein